MNPKPLTEYTDLELSEVLNQVYQQLMQAQGNLQAIQGEILKRKEAVPPKEPVEPVKKK